MTDDGSLSPPLIGWVFLSLPQVGVPRQGAGDVVCSKHLIWNKLLPWNSILRVICYYQQKLTLTSP